MVQSIGLGPFGIQWVVPVTTFIGLSAHARSRGGFGSHRVGSRQGRSHLLAMARRWGRRGCSIGRGATWQISITIQDSRYHIFEPHLHRRCAFLLIVPDKAAELITSGVGHGGRGRNQSGRGLLRARRRCHQTVAMGCSGYIGILGEVLATYSRNALCSKHWQLWLQRVIVTTGIVSRQGGNIHARQ